MDCQAAQLCSSQLFDTPERMDLPELEKAEKRVCNRLTFPLVVLGRHYLDIGDQCLLRPGLYVRTGVVFRKVCVVGTKPGQSGGQFKWRPQSQPQRFFALF